MKKTLEPIQNPRKLMDYHFALGYAALAENNYKGAIEHLMKTDQNNISIKYMLAQVYEKAADKPKAIERYSEIVDHNFNNVGYALVRNEVKAKMQSAATTRK